MNQLSIDEKIQLTRNKNKIDQYLQDEKLVEMRVTAIGILSQNLKELLQEFDMPSIINILKTKSLEETIKEYEISIIKCALIISGGNQRKAAKLLKSRISTLNAKIKRYGIPSSGLTEVLDS